MMNKLRKLQKDDLDMVLSWRNSDAVRLNMFHHKIITKAEHYAWFEKVSQDASKIYLIYQEDSVASGLVSFVDIERKFEYNSRAEQSRAEQSRAEQSRAEQSRAEYSTAHWGFYSVNSTKNKGVGTRMASSAFEYAFCVLNLDLIKAQVLEFNQRSLNYHLKLGFKQTGVLQKSYLREEIFYDIHQLEFSRNDWLLKQNKV